MIGPALARARVGRIPARARCLFTVVRCAEQERSKTGVFCVGRDDDDEALDTARATGTRAGVEKLESEREEVWYMLKQAAVAYTYIWWVLEMDRAYLYIYNDRWCLLWCD